MPKKLLEEVCLNPRAREWKYSRENERVKPIHLSATTGLKVPFSTAFNPHLLQWSQQ